MRPDGRARLVSCIVGAVLLGLLAWARGWPPLILATDLQQERVNQALPLPRGGVRFQQTFTPLHDGLREVEVLLARWAPEDAGGTLHFRLMDDGGRVLTEQSVRTQTLTHNQPWTLRLPRQDGSAGQRYTLEVVGDDRTPFSLWGYTLPVLDGALTVQGAVTPVQSLRLVTRYELTPLAALQVSFALLLRHAPLFALAAAFLFLPGSLVLTLATRRLPLLDPAAWWALALALGLSLWPLLWFFPTLLGLRWSGPALWGALAVGWSLVGVQNAKRKTQNAKRERQWSIGNRQSAIGNGLTVVQSKLETRSSKLLDPILILLLALALLLRLAAVRDVAFPLWVDAVRHATIAGVMAAQGQVLRDYAPILPEVTRFPYHFGFHVLPASLHLMTGWPLPGMLLALGQGLNALMVLATYGAAQLATGQRGAARLAAFLVALPFFFPAYYATWGRFTQLAGMLVLPPLAALTWRLARGGRWRRTWWLVGLLAAGLFFLHLRVFLFYLPFAGVAWAAGWGRGTRGLLGAGTLGGLLVAPRVVELLAGVSVRTVATSFEGYNSFPKGYVLFGWERWFLLAGGLALLVCAGAVLRGRRWAGFPLALAAWVALLVASLAGRRLGLPESWLVNLNSLYITLFFPLAVVIGVVGERLVSWGNGRKDTGAGRRENGGEESGPGSRRKHFASPLPSPLTPLFSLLFGALLTALLFFGLRQQLTILNPETVLARPADAAALAWVAANTPHDARFAVSSWKWLGEAWSGSDGGAWLVPATGRASTTPPADYIYNAELAAQVRGFNEAAIKVKDWADPAVARWLRAEGVTYLFVGARGGFLDPAALAQNSALRMVYGQGGAFVFKVLP